MLKTVSDQGQESQGPVSSRDAAETLLSLRDVKKFYTPTFAGVDGVSFDVAKGEILTLLGPSGCGKTSTLRVAMGLERASSGQVVLNGRTVDAPAQRIFVPTEKRNMGMVFQSYAIWPHMTVAKNVAYPLETRRRPAEEIKQEVSRLLALVGLDRYADRPGTKLSGGQQQRVAIARGLAVGSDILVMDEPFSNLDAHLRHHMRAEVKLLQRRLGIAVLFVTHDQSEALALSDRIAVMRAGKIEQIGRPQELYRAPRTAHVRSFLGENVLLGGTIAGREHGSVIVRLDEGSLCEAHGGDHALDTEIGGRCTVAIRPENIRIEASSNGPHALDDEKNATDGKILALLFLGNSFEAEVSLRSGAIITVHLPAATSLREGDNVRLKLPAECLSAWPLETEHREPKLP